MALAVSAWLTRGVAVAAPAGVPDVRSAAFARGLVEVVGGLVDVSWDGPGTVARILVGEGQKVAAGAPLIEIERTQQRHEREIARGAERQTQLAAQALAAQLPLERARERRLREAVRSGGVAEQQLADVRRAVLSLESQLRVAQAAHAQAAARLSLAEWEYERRVLRAASSGTVLRIHARAGGAPAAAPVLMTVVPDAKHLVRAEFSAYYAEQLHVGMKASFVRDALAAPLPLEGEVVQVNDVYTDSRFGADGTGVASGRVIEAQIALPDDHGLRVGELLRVNVYGQ